MSQRTIVELTCDRCGVVQRFELSSNHGSRLVATTNMREMMDLHQWEQQKQHGGSQFTMLDICRACNGRQFH
jgi:hypothetical protein